MNYTLSAMLVLVCLAGQSALGAEPTVSFRKDVAPILLENCLACHGAKKAEGGYRVDSYSELRKAGDSGEIPIAEDPKDPSELLRRIACEDEFERMPPESDPLAAEQVSLVEKWIAEGAKFDGDKPEQELALVIPPSTYAAPPEKYAHAVPITAVTFSPDGQQVVVGGYHELTVWKADDATLVRRISNLGQRIFALSFAPDGKTLAVGCGEPGKSGEVRLIDFASGEVKGVIARTHDVVLDVAFRPGAPEIAVAAADSSLRIINTETLQEVRTIASHADWVNAVAWSDDGSILVSGSRDKSAKVYNAATGELLASYQGHGSAVRGVSVLPDNTQVASVGADGKLHRWQVADAKKVAEVPLGSEGQKIVRVGTELFVPCVGQRLVRINLADNKITQDYKGHSDWVLTVAQQPGEASERLLASGSFNGELRLWKTGDATPVHSWIAKP
ncbi:c-type cytochrome domain-containing protein [Blastopirellula marina]|uniref:Cytochrome C Planctomycete-type domain-containing protein n=1 Tax=Blastopirellula marina TaxID=124 RepID=A0A2S8FN61_9BACT|nr:c-type cytochrome domain-containing protein [Blastopirellula marina]PQO33623.1 hypothetical protein C5Y98_15390 [Blastopirellula marina]PTL43410.1 hypothetical protein C5Y97_15400 [Blastopirellula marina]